jgi:membrane peptidoglycan carboxypeptidase
MHDNSWFNHSMPSPESIVRKRRERRREQSRQRSRTWRAGGIGLGVVLSIAVGLLMLAGGLAYADLTHDLPNTQYLGILLNPPDGLLLQPTRIYDRSGAHLLLTLAPSDAPRRYLPLNPQNPQHLPDALARATVALFDPEFWTHGGYHLEGWQDPASHPTLAQRLVSDLLLYDEPPSLRRALRERMLAAQATREYGRTQILEWMLNYSDYGYQAVGAEAAAQLYLGKSATELTPGESMLLAATGRAPELNPIDVPEVAVARRNTTIEVMRSLQLIGPEEAAGAMNEPPPPAQRSLAAEAGVAPAFLRLMRSQLDQEFARTRIERGGVIIVTTLDYDLQLQATCTTLTFAARLAGESDPSTTCPGADQLPALPPDTRVQAPSASALILNPGSGQVLAAVGETLSDIETPSMSAHDPGSLADPFVYLTAFTRGYSPASLVWDIPPQEEAPRPGTRYYGPVRMRTALANDLAAPVQALREQLGPQAIDGTEASFGLRPESATLLDMAAAYGVFAANGVRYGYPGPTTVLRVEGADHSLWLNHEDPQAQPVLAAPLAYLMNNVLSDETARERSLGSINPLEIERPAGAKIGRTESGTDAWVAGYTPARVAVVWVGSSAEDSTPGRSPRVAASLWNALMRAASQGVPADGWLVPAGVTAVDVCDPSGMLPTRDCPSIVSEVFMNGSEPVQTDTLYRKAAVNRETGLLATVFTPAELVEERVYMVLPDEALEWGSSTNVPIAPTGYDAIQAAPIDPDVRISAPAMFDQVAGQVQIRGTASGADFDRYRVLVGQGLNPRAWTSLGPEPIDPVQDGLLATWDTTGLSGLYAIQLQVIRSDQRVDTAVIQVTVTGN